MFSVEKVSFSYDESDAALRDVTLNVKRGEFVGVTGASGSGKSTLLRAMVGIVPHYLRGHFFGAVKVNGVDTLETTPQELAHVVGFVGEDIDSQLICETVEEEILFGLENFSVPHEEIESRITSVLDTLGMAHMRNKRLTALSGGQRQKAALAAMLALSPEALILDNPSAELDPAATENLYKAFAALNARGMTIIAAEQKLSVLCRYASRMVIMKGGSLLACGDTQSIMNDTDMLIDAGLMIPKRAVLASRLRKDGLYSGDVPLDIPRAAEMVRVICRD